MIYSDYWLLATDYLLMNKHIEQAIENLRSAAVRVERPERYYDGRHDLRFATEKFENTFGTLFREFALNLCPAVCDALKDKLRITGFSVESVGNAASPPDERKGSALPAAVTQPAGGYASQTGGVAARQASSGSGKAKPFH